MRKKTTLRLHRNVYIIITGIVLLAAAVQITNSEYLLQFNRNQNLTDTVQKWRPEEAKAAAASRSGPPFCLIYDPDDPEGYYEKINANAERVLEYMKRPVRQFDAETFRPEGCGAVVLSSAKLGLVDVAALADYVERGGYALITTTPNLDDAFYQLYRKMGIRSTGDYAAEHSIELTGNVLIGEQGLAMEEDFITNMSLRLELEDESRLLAQTASRVPLLWDHAYGQGKFMVFNGTMLQEKTNRGLIAGAISMLIPDFIYPVFNAKLMFIDDFPAPIADTIDRSIYDTYNRDRVHFFKEIWWPDMLKVAKQHGLEYTAVLIHSYTDQVQPPFAGPVDEDPAGLISYGREVIKSGGEIGLHGFNHQSLVTDSSVAAEFGYTAWDDAGDMAAAIRETVAFAAKAFPQYRLITYVPPSNVLSPEGREALKAAWPDMGIIASLYGEDATGLSYVQEYEIASDGILELPRVTSGYLELPFDRWAEANAMTSLGIFSHFVHPDDVLSAERSGNRSWEDLYDGFKNMQRRLNETYPWLRPLTAVEAGIEAERVLTSAVEWEREEDGTLNGTIQPFDGTSYYIFRTEKKINATSGCRSIRIDEGTYLIEAQKSKFSIHLGG